MWLFLQSTFKRLHNEMYPQKVISRLLPPKKLTEVVFFVVVNECIINKS